jgi:SsrA-binding protein
MAKTEKQKQEQAKRRIENRRAWHEYHIHEKLEVGIMLRGTEVKSIRAGVCSLAESFARVEPATMELWIYQMDIGAYSHAAPERNHEPQAPRKLLARRRQIADLFAKTQSASMTLVPLCLYFNDRGIAKIELGLASGKSQVDKRQSIKKKEADREMQRGMTRKRL